VPFLAELVETTELVTVDGRRAVLSARTSPTGMRAGDGIVLVRRDHFLAVGGFNSRLSGWGYEDTDLQVRLQFKLGLERVERGEVLHLTHSAAARDREAWRRNKDACMQQYARGDYDGSLDHDGRAWRQRVVAFTSGVRSRYPDRQRTSHGRATSRSSHV
jgi:hypothetical protein